MVAISLSTSERRAIDSSLLDDGLFFPEITGAPDPSTATPTFTTYISTDFSTANGSAWPDPWVRASGTYAYSVSGGRGAMVSPGGYARTSIRADPTSAIPADVEMSGKYIPGPYGYSYPFLRSSPAVDSGRGYFLDLMPDAPGFVTRGGTNSAATYTSVDIGTYVDRPTITAGVSISFRFRAQNEANRVALGVKLWLTSETEPAAWQTFYDTSADRITQAGYAGLSFAGDAGTLYWDDLLVRSITEDVVIQPPVDPPPTTTTGFLLRDTFARVSMTSPGTADTGQVWVPRGGTWGTPTSGQFGSITKADGNYVNIPLGSRNQDVSVTLVAGRSTQLYPALIFRAADNGDAFTGYRIEVNNNGAFVIAGGMSTQPGSSNNAVQNGDRLRATCTDVGGNTLIEGYVNDIKVFTTTDSGGATKNVGQTGFGFRHGATASGLSILWSNLAINPQPITYAPGQFFPFFE